MDLRKGAPAAIVGAVIVLSTFAGIGQRSPRSIAATAPAPVVSLAPVVVIAKNPTLSEILDLVLHERPTAAEMGTARANGFPGGSEEAHVAQVLSRYTKDVSLADRISSALVKEGRRRHIGSSLLVGVLLTENPDLNPRATSSVGARGLMQVMPFHAGKWGCGSRDLFNIESNICHGVAVLADNLSGARSLPQALLGYNGCVRGTNTPDCRKYPRIVYGRARKGEDSASRAFVQ
jgi:soluble lytic murein transglycosylase-like protein